MKKVLKIYLLIASWLVLYSFGMSSYENIKANNNAKKFMDKGMLVEVDLENRITYYEVENENYKNEYRPFFDDDRERLGMPGDILLTTGSNFPENKLIDWFVGYYFGKHAALVLDNGDYAEVGAGIDEAIDILDFCLWPRDKENISGTGPEIYRERWIDANCYKPTSDYYQYYHGFDFDESYGMRIKGITDEERKMVSDIAREIIDENPMYNYLFFINKTNGVYCTSFIKNAYERLGDKTGKYYNTDYDGFTITVNDIILARDTYMFYYFYVDDKGMGHFYYLKGEKVWIG